MIKKTNIYGFYITYEESVYDGIRYLRDDLDFEEARVFFDQARQRGYANFEDNQDRQYTLY